MNADIQRVVDYVESHKKVSFKSNKLEADVKLILEAVDQVNGLTELETKVGGETLDDAKLPTWVAPLIYPSKVSVLPGYEYPDLVLRPGKNSEWMFDIVEVTMACNRIAQMFKSSPEMKSVRELRSDCTVISNVRFSVNGWVRQNGDELYYPVPLVDQLGSILGSEWGMMKADRMVELYFARAFKI